MQFELTREYVESLKEAVAAGNNEFLATQVEELHPQDIAAIFLELDNHEARKILELLDKDTGAAVISELEVDVRRRFFKTFTLDQIADYINYLESDDAVDILNEQPVKTREEVIDRIENEEKANHIRDLLNYDEDCAGGLMAKELIKANINWTITQCIDEIRRQSQNVDNIYSIYVVNNFDKLLGRLSLSKMFLAPDNARVEDIFESDIISVDSYTEAEEVASIMQKYDLDAIPVVNVHGKLLGRITIDDVVDVITEKAETDMQMMAGIYNPPETEEEESVWNLSRSRLPWLLIGMCGGILGARFIGLFEKDIQLIPAMAFFIPLITATGGNVGIQSSSVVVQDIANRSGILEFKISKLFKGFLVALLNGIAISSIVFVVNTVIGEEMKLAIVVSVALLSVVILASFMGTITPYILHKLGFNPALAAGPFITTANDLLGLAIYFLVAQSLYHL